MGGDMDDAQGLSPIAAGLWDEGPPPRLIGGRKANGEIVFPLPDEPLEPLERVELSATGTLWSWTSQEFQPKPPFASGRKKPPSTKAFEGRSNSRVTVASAPPRDNDTRQRE